MTIRLKIMKEFLLKGTFIIYLLIGLEIFIMISPFAVYFYSFYSPLLDYLGLGISGFGLLLYWPRFLILILYVTMLS